MSFSEKKRKAIKTYLLEKIRCDDCLFIKKAEDNFGISQTTVRRYVCELIDERYIYTSDESRCGYQLRILEKQLEFLNEEDLDEDNIYQESIASFLDDVSEKTKRILRYVFTEIMNNAIEHSKGNGIHCKIRKDCLYTEISIVDDGMGIYNNIMKYAKAELHQEITKMDAVAELYKGRFTTKPENHSGEGIFFSSKMLASFVIWSDDMVYSYQCFDKDTFIHSHLVSYYTKVKKIGTMVIMKIENDTKRSMNDVFELYAPVEDGFVKTYLPVKELCPFGDPIARSQARRIVRRLEEFKEVIFDFKDIEFMGQGFSDEVFRVFHHRHPKVILTIVNANKAVLGMIKHVQSGNA